MIDAVKDKGWIEIGGASKSGKKKPNAEEGEAPATSSRSWVRLKAVEALQNIGDARAVPALTEALNDKREPVREAAKQALEKLNAKNTSNV